MAWGCSQIVTGTKTVQDWSNSGWRVRRLFLCVDSGALHVVSLCGLDWASSQHGGLRAARPLTRQLASLRGSVRRDEGRSGLALEATPCHLRHTLVSQRSHKILFRFKGGYRDLSTQWENWQSHVVGRTCGWEVWLWSCLESQTLSRTVSPLSPHSTVH